MSIQWISVKKNIITLSTIFEIFAVDGIIHPSNIKGHGKDDDTVGLSINDLFTY